MRPDTGKCPDRELGERLAAYELGLLDSDERRRFEDHLRECPACQEELFELAPYMAALNQEPGRYAAQVGAALRAASSSPWAAWRDWLKRLGKRL